MKKNVRILSFVMAAALTIAQTPVSVAAEEEQPPHECATVMVTEVVEQTHTMTCADCGAAVTETHSFGDWCMQDEQCHVRTCTCEASVTELHTWDDGVFDEATGVRVYTCMDCSASYTETAESSEEETVKTSTDEDAEASSEVETAQSPKTPLIGDVDGDGQVTADDMMIVSAISMGDLSSATECQLSIADINHDGWIDEADVMSIYAILIA